LRHEILADNKNFVRHKTFIFWFRTTSITRLRRKISWNLFMRFFAYTIALALLALLL